MWKAAGPNLLLVGGGRKQGGGARSPGAQMCSSSGGGGGLGWAGGLRWFARRRRGRQRHVSPRFIPPAVPEKAAGPGVHPGVVRPPPRWCGGRLPLASHFRFSFLTAAASCTTSLYTPSIMMGTSGPATNPRGVPLSPPDLSRSPQALATPPDWGHPGCSWGFTP